MRTSVARSPLAQTPINFSATSLCSAVLTAARPWGCSGSIFPRARAASCRQDCARRPRVSPADRGLGAAGGAVRDTSRVFWFLAAALRFAILMYGMAEILAARGPSTEEYVGILPAVAIVPFFFAGSTSRSPRYHPGWLTWPGCFH